MKAADARRLDKLAARIRRLRAILKAPTAPAALIARPKGQQRDVFRRRVKDLIRLEQQMNAELVRLTGASESSPPPGDT